MPAKVAAYKEQPADKLKLQTLITRRVALVEHKRVWCATSAYGQRDALPEAVKTACRQADYATGGRESHTLQDSNRLVAKGCNTQVTGRVARLQSQLAWCAMVGYGQGKSAFDRVDRVVSSEQRRRTALIDLGRRVCRGSEGVAVTSPSEREGHHDGWG